ncbi:MAG TPA: response regulator transcription factor [Bryobacteraceae bacterium]|jgi:DNA-binding response OmpR family regulator
MDVLLVEDEARMAELLRHGLEEEGISVTVTNNGAQAFGIAQSSPFDVIVLDVMLPGWDGFTVARRLRESQNRTPILMLTARDAQQDVVNGLNIGADDYLTKPFSFEILLARIRAVSRRGPISQPVILNVGNLTLDETTREVARGRRSIHLTRTEYAILLLLLRNAGRVVTRNSILEKVWGHDTEVENNTLDAFMRLLRSKLEQPGEDKLLHTVRGVGYSLRKDGE